MSENTDIALKMIDGLVDMLTPAGKSEFIRTRAELRAVMKGKGQPGMLALMQLNLELQMDSRRKMR